MIKKIGVLTGGGDCPGLNAVIYGIIQRSFKENIEVLGFSCGWKGLIEDDKSLLNLQELNGIIAVGGTILKTSRTNPFSGDDKEVQSRLDDIQSTFENNSLDALIAIGGEDTLGVCSKLYKKGFPCIGVPKTIDNDLSETDYTFGFDTSVNIAMEALDRLKTTALSHQRVMVVEIMGRHAGWIALHAGLAGNADVILIPEKKYNLDKVLEIVKRSHAQKKYSIVAISEGAVEDKDSMVLQSSELDSFGHVRLGGVAETLSNKIEEKTGLETRSVVLGHLQRGGAPSAFDRILGLRFGLKAVELVLSKQFGKMTALKGTSIVPVSIEKAVEKLKIVDDELYESLKLCFT